MKKKTGAREWSGSSCNIQSGCSNDCKYCYAKAISAKIGRKKPEDWANEKIDKKAVDKEYGLRGPNKQPIMFPTLHDLSVSNWNESYKVLSRLLEVGNNVLIVSKPDPAVISAFCLAFKKFKKQILFRFTIGSASDRVLKFWEPGAPNLNQRLQALKNAFNMGFETSISCEPMLDDRIDKVIDLVKPYVTEKIWLGKMNKIQERFIRNQVNEETTQRGKELEGLQRDEAMLELYEKYKNDNMIEWKDSIKEVLKRHNKLK